MANSDDYHTNLGQAIEQYAENLTKITAIKEKLGEFGVDCDDFDDNRFGSTDQKIVKDYFISYHQLAASNVELKAALLDMNVDISAFCRYG